MEELEEELSDEEIHEMIRVADMEGDGKINFEEFTKVLYQQ